jgi:hypothetical protein
MLYSEHHLGRGPVLRPSTLAMDVALQTVVACACHFVGLGGLPSDTWNVDYRSTRNLAATLLGPATCISW